jgi:hypothetical protein
MCDRCTDLEEKITHYRTLLERVSDAQMSHGITGLIVELERQKTDLHPPTLPAG